MTSRNEPANWITGQQCEERFSKSNGKHINAFAEKTLTTVRHPQTRFFKHKILNLIMKLRKCAFGYQWMDTDAWKNEVPSHILMIVVRNTCTCFEEQKKRWTVVGKISKLACLIFLWNDTLEIANNLVEFFGLWVILRDYWNRPKVSCVIGHKADSATSGIGWLICEPRLCWYNSWQVEGMSCNHDGMFENFENDCSLELVFTILHKCKSKWT